MQRVRLGRQGPWVSRLCFGTLTLGPLQLDLEPAAGGELIAHAAKCGVNFVDTADSYGTYPHIAHALKQGADLVICTKAYVWDEAGARLALERAQDGLGRKNIDIFLLHEQESEHTLRGHEEALVYLAKMRRAGVIGAIGLSTHHVAGARAAATFGRSFGGLDVLHPIYNQQGLGIADGTRAEMAQAMTSAHALGLGIFAMKALGGGHLIGQAQAALDHVLGQPFVHSVAVGMGSQAEIEVNVALVEGREPDPAQLGLVGDTRRRLLVHSWCEGCGACVRRCGFGAMHLVAGKAVPDPTRCVRCGYCAKSCPQFCIKVV